MGEATKIVFMAIILLMNLAKKRIFERFNIFLLNTFTIAYKQLWTPKNDREQPIMIQESAICYLFCLPSPQWVPF